MIYLKLTIILLDNFFSLKIIHWSGDSGLVIQCATLGVRGFSCAVYGSRQSLHSEVLVAREKNLWHQGARCLFHGQTPITIFTFLYFCIFSNILTGAPNDSFLSNPLKRNFRLSGVPLKLCRFISGRAIIFLSVRSF